MMEINTTREQLLQEIAELKASVAELERDEISDAFDRAQTEKALRLSEEKFSNAFHSSPDIITISSLSEALYIDVNDAYLITVGYERNEVIGHTSYELNIWHFPLDRAILLQQIKENGRVRNLDFIFRNRSGELKTTLISADIINVGGEDCLLCVVKDISDRKQMEQALILSEQRFNTAFHASPITMSITTLEEGCFLDINDSFCRVLGSTREKLLQSNSKQIGFWADPAQREKVTQVISAYGSVRDLEVRFRRASGEIRLGLYSAERIEVDGEICILSQFIDLTERKQMEIEMSRLGQLNLVGEMAASIAHEIRNPMTTVRGYIQMLRENEKYEQEIESFDLMIEELDRANSIITEFLSLAKNKMVELKPLNLNTVLKNVYPLMLASAMVQDKMINLDLGDIPELLLNEQEIRQLILNLLNNGLESIPEGKAVFISTYTKENQVILAVCDQGKGISNEIMEKLGTPFFSTKEGGTGLGLAVCYGIASRSDAKIEIETGPQGSTFFVCFPKG